MNEKVNKIKAYLAEAANNVIVMRTYGHNVVYKPKHADLFVKEDAQGIYIKAGKKLVYYRADAVFFAHTATPKTAAIRGINSCLA